MGTLNGVCLSYWLCSKTHLITLTEPHAIFTLTGAMKDNVEVLKQGFLTILPTCDKAGRRILFMDRSVITEYNPTTDERLQMLWYLLHILMCNPDAQQSGFVTLANARGASIKDWDPRWASQGSVIGRTFPIERTVFHAFGWKPIFRVLANAMKAVLSPKQRRSFLIHNGTEERVVESLSEYCLPKHCLPTEIGGTLHVSRVAFVQERLVIEGGALKPNGNITKDLSQAHASENECSQMNESMILSHAGKAIPKAEPIKERAQFGISSHNGPRVQNTETTPVVCQESNVQHAPHKRVLSPPIASCALNNDTVVPIQNSSRRNIHPDNNNLECWSNLGHVLPYKHDSIGEECLSAKLDAPSNTNAPQIGDLTTTDIPQEKNPLKQKKQHRSSSNSEEESHSRQQKEMRSLWGPSNESCGASTPRQSQPVPCDSS